MIGSLSCEELSVVEPDAMVQQEFYIGYDYAFAVTVDRTIQFFTNFFHAADDGLAFAFRCM